MDLTILHSTLTAVEFICTWIEQLHSKQQKIRQLGQSVQALSLVLEPLQQPSSSSSMDLDKNVVILLYDLVEILNGVKGHLTLWGGKTKTSKEKMVQLFGFLNPSFALGMISDDEKKLSQWINLFMLSLQIAMLKKQAKVDKVDKWGKVEKVAESAISEKRTLDGNWVPSNKDVSLFWSKSFGEEKIFISSTKFIAALEIWVQDHFDETLRNALLLELDEQDIGGVRRNSLERFVGSRTLKGSIDDLKAQHVTNDAPPPPYRSTDLVPTLVWVDDEAENIREKMNYAIGLGIRVVHLPSTIAAKLWIGQNEAELRTLEGRNLLHFITDNARWEIVPSTAGEQDRSSDERTSMSSSSSPSLNISAGETILRFLRGNGYKAPVLVYCGRSVRWTQYVLAYSRAASTCYQAVCNAFIERLAAVHHDTHNHLSLDKEFWVNYGEQKGFNLQPWRRPGLQDDNDSEI
ncbi:hypothetical protein APHAL10511_005792 [Amanita phalloides]|nr:hypothetical protein APHAL10511_005792 [Amanita phalloides]